MPTMTQVLRARAFRVQNGRCFYCGVAMWLASPCELPGEHPQPSPTAVARLKCTAEHLVPRSEGGKDAAGNIAAACAHCNLTRHKRKHPPAPDAYRAEVSRRVNRGTWHHGWVFERKLLSPSAESRATTLTYPAKAKNRGVGSRAAHPARSGSG
jgi:hypothetical protein